MLVLVLVLVVLVLVLVLAGLAGFVVNCTSFLLLLNFVGGLAM